MNLAASAALASFASKQTNARCHGHVSGASGFAPSLPIYQSASIGGFYTADMLGSDESNRLAQNPYYRIVGDGLPVTVAEAAPVDRS